MNWTIDLNHNTATSDTGLIFKFSPDPETPGAWNGTCLNPESVAPDDIHLAANLSKQAGDALISALKKEKK